MLSKRKQLKLGIIGQAGGSRHNHNRHPTCISINRSYQLTQGLRYNAWIQDHGQEIAVDLQDLTAPRRKHRAAIGVGLKKFTSRMWDGYPRNCPPIRRR